ncbi:MULTISPECIES: antitoxin VapB family protein [unclassified Archaeoglobus]|jgi:predicted CopG family antitoxin|uniref:antitoxin VapB family protein n=1 Tax=unclassified Archaeoglobus TaxID=2643606 RepID=UPI0025BAB908|nr:MULTISPECIES: antitoxin VapB family protein [unclassified Archaeoglobus]
MVKTVTIADDVYEELVRIKGNRSFSEVIRELLKSRKGNTDALVKIFGVLSEEEYTEAKSKIDALKEDFEKWGQSLTQM